MYFSHEFVEMQTGFALYRYRLVKAIHQKAFAATDTTIQIHPFWYVRVVDQLFQLVAPFMLVIGPLRGAAIKHRHRTHLGRIGSKSPVFQFLLVSFKYGHGGRIVPFNGF